MSNEEILSALEDVRHPAKNDRSIVELGMVKDIQADGDSAVVTLEFPKHRDPLAEYLIGATKAVLLKAGFKNADVRTVIKEEPKKPAGLDLDDEELKGIGKIIAVCSGKGGVGKSTVAVNLAIALARLGYKVGLADADVYGPSIPRMTGTEDISPMAIDDEGRERFIPIEKYGVKWMSIGYFASPDQALIWRGPMACNALKQMILQVRWEELDFLLIDMPPGTGDIHISLMGDIRVDGAIVVTTPSDVALRDVEKSVSMLLNPKIAKPILGVVENMSWFTPLELPDNRYYIFGEGGAERLAAKYGLRVLGQIPLVQGIREGGDGGEPVALKDTPDAQALLSIAKEL